MSRLLAGNTAVVTGASSGIGRAIALTFAKEGARVALADVIDTPLEGGDTTLNLIQSSGGEAFYERVDVGQWPQVDALIGATVARYGRLDIMVNNAAISSATGLLETTEAQWEDVMRVNLTGMFHGCKRAV
jgi:glucose 1-dehydrogenase